MNLGNCRKNCSYRVESLPDNRLLRALGIREGLDFKMETRQILKGPVVIKVGNRSIAIASCIAEEILVKEVA